MSEVFVALGSNIDPDVRLQSAARLLKSHFPDARFSSCYRNAAVGFDGDDFINAVVAFSTGLPVTELLRVLHAIEEQCGRSRADSKWGPRAMDLDLLLYGDEIGEGAGYVLPRRDMLRRAYMLGPLAELAPDVSHPVAGETIGALWRDFPQAEHPMIPTAPDLNAA
jgi:2-amino-4-hydroxy-6-hydroxymethyldihydropteridine diphosphokinase